MTGIHDDPRASERTIWLDGEPTEVGPVEFAADLSASPSPTAAQLDFTEWSARERLDQRC